MKNSFLIIIVVLLLIIGSIAATITILNLIVICLTSGNGFYSGKNKKVVATAFTVTKGNDKNENKRERKTYS